MSRRKSLFSKIVFVNLLLMFFCINHSLPAQSHTPKDRDKLLQTRKQLENEIRYATELLDKTRKNKQASLNKLEILAKQVRSRQALINAINTQLDDVEVQISVENLRIEQMSKQLRDLKNEYARMIYYAYRTMNGHNKMMFIFSARDFNQAYQRLKYYQQYSSYRRSQAAKIESTQRAIASHHKELEAEKTNKLTLVQSQREEKQKLDQEKQGCKNAGTGGQTGTYPGGAGIVILLLGQPGPAALALRPGDRLRQLWRALSPGTRTL